MNAHDTTPQEADMKVSKTIIKAASSYLSRVRSGERIMRDAAGHLQWSSGKPVGRKTLEYMLSNGRISELDTDLFGDFSRGQTLGIDGDGVRS